jgi:hypothetical protein
MKEVIVDHIKIPTSNDFTEVSLNKALLQSTNSHWLIRYTPSVLGGVLLVGVLFGFSYGLFLSLLGIISMASITWVYKYFSKGADFRKTHIKRLHQMIELATESRRKNLKEDLLDLSCNQGSKQVDLFQQKFDNLIDILKSKFDINQLTYNRYYSIAQEVLLSGIDNLASIVMALKTLQSIDLDYINQRLVKLEQEDETNMAVRKEKDALIRSLKSFQDQNNRMKELLAENEQALTQIDESSVAISKIKRSKEGEAKIDMELSMKELQKLAQRSYAYSR